MRYADGMTLRQIGRVLGVTEARVSQIHAQMRRELRVTLGDDAALFGEVA